MSDLTVSKHFVQAALVGAERLGFDTREMLLEAGISPDLLRIEMARVSGDQFSHLMQVLWNRMSDEFMGLGPRRARAGTFATMCALVIDCPTLESVYRQVFQFSRLEGVYALNKISIFSRAKQGGTSYKKTGASPLPAFASKAESACRISPV